MKNRYILGGIVVLACALFIQIQRGHLLSKDYAKSDKVPPPSSLVRLPLPSQSAAASNSSVESKTSQRSIPDTLSSKQKPAAETKVKNLSASEIEVLKGKVLDLNQRDSLRSASLYELTQAGILAASALTEVAIAPVPILDKGENPHSIKSFRHTYETSLRIRAVEALDQMLVSHPEVIARIREAGKNSNSQVVVFLSQLSIAGVQQGRPGKVSRFVNETLNEVGKR